MTSIIIVSVNQFQIIIVLILPTLNGNWFSDCMFEFILCINWKSVLCCPWKLLYWRPWLVQFRWNRVAKKGGFPCFSWKQINWLLQGGNHIDVHYGRCANSLEFSRLLWQPVINFSALAQAGSVQNPTGFYKGNIMNFERSKLNLLLKKIASKHWEPLKRKVVT